MLNGHVGPVEVFFNGQPKANFGNFYWPGASGSLSSPAFQFLTSTFTDVSGHNILYITVAPRTGI